MGEYNTATTPEWKVNGWFDSWHKKWRPEPYPDGEWECYWQGLHWKPSVPDTPNAFRRRMQSWLLGVKWRRREDNR